MMAAVNSEAKTSSAEAVQGRLKVALAGCGKVARKHLKALYDNRDQFQLIALVDTSPERAQTFLRTAPDAVVQDVRCYQSLDALWLESARRPDVLVITTPSGSHYALAASGLAHNCHVFIEKPMTLKLTEARDLTEQARQSGRIIVMGHIYRYFPLVQLIQEDVASGRLGRVYSGQVTVCWGHDQAYYDSAAWRGTWAADGGVLMNQSIHALDLMCWLMNGQVSAANCRIARLAHRMEAEDLGMAVLEMKDGALCQLIGTTNTSPQRPMADFVLITEKADLKAGIKNGRPYFQATAKDGSSLTWQYIRRQWQQMRQQGLSRSIRQIKNPHSAIYRDLAEAIKQHAAPRADALSGLHSVENILAVYQSAQLGGQTVYLPLKDFDLSKMRDFFTPDVPHAESD
ncbi:Gfo/Idh/MocA family oxidoreductase [Oscillospiraceae bacterium HV4-5-C5C]|nr:Gfo/Idh/MocA family oxidoreductase [Oscillospiraceae bacterium HV4-5-C5C]